MANIGTVDRLLRLVVGLGLIAFGLYDTTPLRWLGLVGLVLIGTALFRFCPAYRLLGLGTAGHPPSS
ncbi:MAG: hypothetical protein B7Z78_13560 [Rhodospirillales bacterium 20-60-12]|nr:MAG: hypothetical protein B7Z78_13560 [Rhodospirillales bacterium 20-60-12]HQT67188.1 DUF2892 domain-containing protein [Acetobacteraceae bacterium]